MSENTTVDTHDRAPGEESAERPKLGVQGYVIGLCLAVLLTVASFAVAMGDIVWEPAVPAALAALGVAQIGVHLVFFLHITTGPDNTNNILALAFGVFIVALVVLGSMWIMANLDHTGSAPLIHR